MCARGGSAQLTDGDGDGWRDLKHASMLRMAIKSNHPRKPGDYELSYEHNHFPLSWALAIKVAGLL